MQDFSKNAFPLGWLKMIRKYEVASMYECMDDCENFTYLAHRRRHKFSDIKLNFLD